MPEKAKKQHVNNTNESQSSHAQKEVSAGRLVRMGQRNKFECALAADRKWPKCIIIKAAAGSLARR